ncbi:MAG TPA: BlaI/MecI/CopY family transcriptional regulator [Planctomycetaceae bacterium]|jgi:predicted transcriptional regulator|nr:BlaI/MecI/CopY family transcriptional regulator [Planctomycetaceae bacterium]
MARPSSKVLTEREYQLMNILWTRGPSTAETVREALSDRPHDSTVRTLLRILKRKGYVRILGQHPAIYEATVARSDVQIKAARSLLTRFFGGSVEALVMRLVEDEELSMEQLAQLRKSLSRRKRKGEKS